MQCINKIGTQSESEGHKITKEFIDSCWHDDVNQYNNLAYDRSHLKDLGPILLKEQSDCDGNSYCCYCMRRLFLTDGDGHSGNVTFEHIIPQNIKREEWEQDKDKYLQFQNLREEYITICYDGTLTDEQKANKMTGMPYPHFVSYHNIVASCDGSTFEKDKPKKSCCCNNCRQERFVMPLYLSRELVDGIGYTNDGKLDYDDSVYDSCWFDDNHLRLTNAWITTVRKMWYKISQSDYSDKDVDKARNDEELRQMIIDDIDSNNEILSWNNNSMVWNLFSEYSWFYQYYKNIQIIEYN